MRSAGESEDPKLAKGLVKREVTRVVTPGTNMDLSGSDETRNNFLMSIVCTEDRFGIAACDVSTGEFMLTEVDKTAKLTDEIYKLSPSEIICNEHFAAVKEKNENTTQFNGGLLGADNPTFHASIGWDWMTTVRASMSSIA